MNRDSKVTIQVAGSITLTVADLLGLDPTEDVPPRDEWADAILETTGQIPLMVNVSVPNPAFDPHTIPMFENTPQRFIEWGMTA